MQQIETVSQFVNVCLQLKTKLCGSRAAETTVKHRASVPLRPHLIEHDSEETRSQVVILSHKLPDRPLRHVSKDAEMVLHGGVKLGVGPGGISACLSDVDDIGSRSRSHFDAGFG